MERDTREDPVEIRPAGDWQELDSGFEDWAEIIFWFVCFVSGLFAVAFTVGAIVGLLGL